MSHLAPDGELSVRVRFFPTGGGIRGFRDQAELVAFLQKQVQEWKSETTFGPLWEQSNSDDYIGALKTILDNWDRVWRRVEGMADLSEPEFYRHAHAEIRHNILVSFDGTAGRAIRDIAARDGRQAAAGALRFFVPDPDPINLERQAMMGFLDGWARERRLDEEAALKSRAEFDDATRDMQHRHVHLQGEFNGYQRELENLYQQAQHELKDASRAAEYGAGELVRQYKEEFANLAAAHTENLKIQEAVKQWKERSANHRGTYKSFKWWTIGVGGFGMLLLAAWLANAFSVIRWSIGITPDQLASPSNLTHEIVLAASISLLLVTIYLWSVRVLVRLMLSEHHLAVDAQSREIMAHTYLWLTKNGAISTDVDRQIVLGTLFRPVVDGLVKDDALPMIGLASILAGKMPS